MSKFTMYNWMTALNRTLRMGWRLLPACMMVWGLAPVSAAMPAVENPWSGSESINTGWSYLQEDTEELPAVDADGYVPATLPHTWNATDTLETKAYRRAASWYRKTLTLNDRDLTGRLYLRFGAAGQQARVYVNGKRLASHAGGYSAFTVEITNAVTVGQNRVDVWVSNRHDKHLAPLSGDFNMYGGLYRGAELLRSPTVCLSRTVFGSPGVRVWSQTVSKETADLYVRATVDNAGPQAGTLQLKARLADTDGTVVSQAQTTVDCAADSTRQLQLPMPPVAAPSLWSPETPTLYTLTVQLCQNDEVLDTVTVQHGFRWFRFDADKGFFLNGEPYRLIGVNRHQDFYREGNALSYQRHYDDIKLMKELGVNWLRLAHYQQNDYVLQLCDQLGILVWEEIPYVNGTTFEPEFEQNLRSMMTDMICQHFNHPSIVLWGMGNEIRMKKRPDGKARCYDIIARLNMLIHHEDPVRKSVLVCGDADYMSKLGVMAIPDVIGYNMYCGWYGSKPEKLTERITQLHGMNPDKPLIISEFGAGSDTTIHTETPKAFDFSEDYQCYFLESHLDQMDRLAWLSGMNWWNFADFGAAHRGDSVPHVNQKGLLTFDRQKKDAFYLWKSRFSKEPVLYLLSPSWTQRSGSAQKTYRVYTNLDEVELFQNGTSLGRQTAGFTWTVTLKPGDNVLVAKGAKADVKKEHGFTVTWQPEKQDE